MRMIRRSSCVVKWFSEKSDLISSLLIGFFLRPLSSEIVDTCAESKNIDAEARPDYVDSIAHDLYAHRYTHAAAVARLAEGEP